MSLSKEVCDALNPVWHLIGGPYSSTFGALTLCGKTLPPEYWKTKWDAGQETFTWIDCPDCCKNLNP